MMDGERGEGRGVIEEILLVSTLGLKGGLCRIDM